MAAAMAAAIGSRTIALWLIAFFSSIFDIFYLKVILLKQL